MEIRDIGEGKRKLLIIDGTCLNFIHYNKADEVISMFKDRTVDAIVSSDSHGDDESLELPFQLQAKHRIFLGDYYPYIPSWFKYREKDREIKGRMVEFIKEKYMHTNETLAKHLNDESSIFLYGNHDPRIFPVSFELNINGFKFLFQHSLTYHDQEGKLLTINTSTSTHFLDVQEESWKEASGQMIEMNIGMLRPPYETHQSEKPLFILPSIKPEVIDAPDGYDYIIIGHLSSYQWMFDRISDEAISLEVKTKISSIQNKLFTIDSSNSSIIEYTNEQVHERKLNHYITRINQITAELPSLNPRTQQAQIKLISLMKERLDKEEKRYELANGIKTDEK